MYRMPALPILQMSGRRYAHHLGALTSPLMTSMRTPVIPSESRYFGCPPQKSTMHICKALILWDFCLLNAEIVWYFGGIYRHIFRGYR